MNFLRAFSSSTDSKKRAAPANTEPVPTYADYKTLLSFANLTDTDYVQKVDDDCLSGTAVSGLLHGEVVFHQQAITANYHYGLKHGLYTRESPEDKKAGSYCFGLRDKRFHMSNCQRDVACTYKRGQLDGPLEITDSGRLSVRAVVVDGKLEGWSEWEWNGTQIKANFSAGHYGRRKLLHLEVKHNSQTRLLLVHLAEGSPSWRSKMSSKAKPLTRYMWYTCCGDSPCAEFRTSLPDDLGDLPPALEAAIRTPAEDLCIKDCQLTTRGPQQVYSSDRPPHGHIGYRICTKPVTREIDMVEYYFPHYANTSKPVRTLRFFPGPQKCVKEVSE